MQHWRDDLQWLADQCVDANVIMAGDFNATVDHMGGLGVDGGTLGRCHDAAIETGNGAVGTWSADDAGAARRADRPRDGLDGTGSRPARSCCGRWTTRAATTAR